jgi:hypothetical protein
MKNRNKFRPTYRATVSVDLYSNSTDSKFDAFASRIAGTNVRLVDSDAGEYVYETTAAGLPIVIERWNTRLGAGMSDCTISVQSA